MLIGPSGCGKSTTLRMINRLVNPSSGTIEIDGLDYVKFNSVELRRRLGYVIQQVGLFPHMTIAENISFVLRLTGVKENKRRARAKELLELVEMSPDAFMDRYPVELSGGEQQRIGVLRALAHDPDIILMDEPFGALDPITREQLQGELKQLQRNVNKTIIFVTHDMDEAIRLGDRIVIMKEGRVIQVASPQHMLNSPADEFVANFIGRQRLLRQASEMMVGEVMAKSVVTIPYQSSLTKSHEVMIQKGLDKIVAVDGTGKFKGFICLDDVKQELAQDQEMSIEAFPKLSNLSIRPESTVLNGIYLMVAHRVDEIPVTEADGTVVGMFTRGDLIELLDAVAGTTSETSVNDNGEKGI